ncbi:MAG: type II secretion system protein [Planctomycetota bacterium]|nr:type II secretion system protein [Planctomycetota bacterium]
MKRQRAGFTLLELTVVLTVLSLVWLCITSVLYTLYRADHRLRDDLQSEQAVDRFAMRLRLDAHDASSANLLERNDGGSELVLLTVDGRAIHYGMSDEGIYRVVRKSEAVVHQDAFLTGRAVPEWELHSPDDPSLIVLTLTSRDSRTQSTRVRHIKAAVSTANLPVAESPEASS